jgi:phosphatidylglycerol---prolipoprotein diacylglyceryl transferase
MSIKFPELNPIILDLYGPLAIRWYGLAYALGIILALYNIYYLAKLAKCNFTKKIKDDLLNFIILGIVLGGRLGYVLFYNFSYYLRHPIEIFQIWQGGMSFHGGFLGVVVAGILFCRKHKISYLTCGDLFAASTGIGLFFGRIANFINAELYGRITDVPWGVVFPNAGNLPRHPSQLYEAFFEGLLPFIILNILAIKYNYLARAGKITGMFLILYSLMRSVIELFRQPDANIGFIFNYLTMGQILSLPMFLAGVVLLWQARKN